MKKNKAIFLDRDGVLNREIGDYVCHKKDFVVNPGVGECLKKFADKGYLLIVITNQGGVSKGLYTVDYLKEMHQILIDELQNHGVKLAEIYACYHHQNQTLCLCRKPLTISFEKAIARFNLDIAQCVMIGDTERDIEAASRVGVRGIKIIANENLLENAEVQRFLNR